ncbi:MAG: sugar phosphate isomerase/epimerase family protein [Ignavibacteriaceae bacterium]
MYNEKIVCAYLYIITKYGYPPPADLTSNYLDEMAKLGFRSIELEGIREEHLQQMFERKNQIKEKLDKMNLQVPFFCAVLPGLTSQEKKERERQLQLFEKGCEIAKLFGSKGILDNAPLPPYKFPDNIPVVRHYDEDVLKSAIFPEGMTWEIFWDYTIETYREACDIAARYNLTYQMHPSIGVLAANTKDFLKFRDAVKRDNLRFNLDTANQFFMKDNLTEALKALVNHIDYIHISDNRGAKVEHLPVGEGRIDWKEFFNTLDKINFKGYLGLDIGGDESKVSNIDSAYSSSAKWLEKNWSYLKN